MLDTQIAAIIAVPLSSLIVAIQITQAAKTSLLAKIRATTFLYFLIVSVGNVFSTFLAAAATSESIPANIAPAWFWYAFIGVFGFEAILKNINVTFANIGVLSINDWITKAKDIAVADAIDVEVSNNQKAAMTLAGRLQMLPNDQLNAHVVNILGTKQLHLLEAEATQAGADPKLVKGLALAKGNYKSALAISPS
ncbi:MAG: hypothetical protein U1F70_00575 [Candidatus Competibacteraceae bacterium]